MQAGCPLLLLLTQINASLPPTHTPPPPAPPPPPHPTLSPRLTSSRLVSSTMGSPNSRPEGRRMSLTTESYSACDIKCSRGEKPLRRWRGARVDGRVVCGQRGSARSSRVGTASVHTQAPAAHHHQPPSAVQCSWDSPKPHTEQHPPDAEQLHVARVAVRQLQRLGAAGDQGGLLALGHHQVDELAAVGDLEALRGGGQGDGGDRGQAARTRVLGGWKGGRGLSNALHCRWRPPLRQGRRRQHCEAPPGCARAGRRWPVSKQESGAERRPARRPTSMQRQLRVTRPIQHDPHRVCARDRRDCS